MRTLLALILMCPALLRAEEFIPRLCYGDVDQNLFCTHDNVGKIQVYLYNAGWCGPCNAEMEELADSVAEFEGAPVVFASLSGEGYSQGNPPDQTFLKSWKAKHHIPFSVAGKNRDFGKTFGNPGSIPFAVIVHPLGTVVKKGNLSVSEITKVVRDLLK